MNRISYIIILVITALIVGTGIFIWQESRIVKLENSFNNKYIESINKISKLQRQINLSEINNENIITTEKSQISISNNILTSNIDTLNWQTYKNEEFGFEVKYPTKYLDNSDYSIWTASNKNIGLLFEWGVNMGQENIFVVSVYPLEYKQKLIDNNQLSITGEQIIFSTKLAADIVSTPLKSFLIENDNYIFVIKSSYSENWANKYKAYEEFYTMLSKFNIKNYLYNQ